MKNIMMAVFVVLGAMSTVLVSESVAQYEGSSTGIYEVKARLKRQLKGIEENTILPDRVHFWGASPEKGKPYQRFEGRFVSRKKGIVTIRTTGNNEAELRVKLMDRMTKKMLLQIVRKKATAKKNALKSQQNMEPDELKLYLVEKRLQEEKTKLAGEMLYAANWIFDRRTKQLETAKYGASATQNRLLRLMENGIASGKAVTAFRDLRSDYKSEIETLSTEVERLMNQIPALAVIARSTGPIEFTPDGATSDDEIDSAFAELLKGFPL